MIPWGGWGGGGWGGGGLITFVVDCKQEVMLIYGWCPMDDTLGGLGANHVRCGLHTRGDIDLWMMFRGLASKSSGGFAARARKAYSKRTAERNPSPAEVQRRIDQSLPEPPTDVTSAIEWLLQNKFVRKPRKCSDCGGLNIKQVFDCEDRPPHWRCTGWTKCQCRISIYAESIFCGLRVDPLKLVAMLYWYLRRSQSECPKVASLVADLQIGRSVAEHFLAALRKVESQAGQAWCRKQKLNGNVECDATALVKFHVKKTNIHYKESIDRLVHALNSRKKKIPGSFVVHVSVLAAQSRDSSPVVYVPKPQVPREHA